MPRNDFTVAWICALARELAACKAMLDEPVEPPAFQSVSDNNVYTTGRIGSHKVIIACLPAGVYGTASAARTAAYLEFTFPSIQSVIVIGIAGGIPSLDRDIRLGDVVISKPTGTHGGVLSYDIGKVNPNGCYDLRGHANKPSLFLLNKVQQLESEPGVGRLRLRRHLDKVKVDDPELGEKCARPPSSADELYTMPVDGKPIRFEKVVREPRLFRGQEDTNPRVHYGLIASGNKVIADAFERETLRRGHGACCIEMAAAGVIDSHQCLVIRGICDYSDAHKQDIWQNYAALTAAACAKELVLKMPNRRFNVHDGAPSAGVPPISQATDTPSASDKFRVSFPIPKQAVSKFVGREIEVERALKLFQEDGRHTDDLVALQLAKELHESIPATDGSEIPHIAAMIGLTLLKLGQFAKGLESFEEALRIFSERGQETEV